MTNVSDAAVTVVIPSYGRPAQLHRAVESVGEDAASGVEIVIVDDAFPDGPQAEDFGDPRVRVVTRDRNGGVAAAQNTGLAEARGRYVAFLHSDDEWVPGRLARQLSLLEEGNEDTVAVESATIRCSGDRERVAAPRMTGRTHEDLIHREVRDLHISGWLFRREALVDIEGFDEQLRCYEDLDLLIRLTAQFPIVTDDGPPVAKIDTGGADRLGSSPWMRRGRLHLVRKYVPQLTSTAMLPAGWRDWCTQAAADLIADPDGDRSEALDMIQRARHRDARRLVGTLDLVVAARLPPIIGSRIAARRQRSWQR